MVTTFLLLHGIPGSARTWNAVAERLGPAQVLVPDLLGFGEAPTPDGEDGLLAESQAAHVESALDRAGVACAVVVGHDFGGPVAAHLYRRSPERVAALALLATNAFPDTPVPFPLNTLGLPGVGAIAERVLFSRPSLELMVRQGTRTPGLRPSMDHYVADARARRSIASIFAASLRRLDELYRPVAETLATVGVPTLVGWGDRDPFFPIEVGQRTAELVPGARFRVYEGAGHFLPEERPAEIANDLRRLAESALAA